MNFEDDLRTALRRESAPPDFAARVLSRTARAKTRAPFWRRPAMLALAAVLVLVAVIPPAAIQYRRSEQRRALRAKDQLMMALSITRAQLRQAKEKVRQSTRHTL